MALAMGKEVSAAASELISGERRGGDLVVTFSRFLPPLCIRYLTYLYILALCVCTSMCVMWRDDAVDSPAVFCSCARL